MAFSKHTIKNSRGFEKKITVGFEKNQIFIKGLAKNSEGKIYDISGKLIENLNLKNGLNSLRTSLPKGNYILQTQNQSVRFSVK